MMKKTGWIRLTKMQEVIRTTFSNHLECGKGYIDLFYNLDLAELLLEGNRGYFP